MFGGLHCSLWEWTLWRCCPLLLRCTGPNDESPWHCFCLIFNFILFSCIEIELNWPLGRGNLFSPVHPCLSGLTGRRKEDQRRRKKTERQNHQTARSNRILTYVFRFISFWTDFAVTFGGLCKVLNEWTSPEVTLFGWRSVNQNETSINNDDFF